MVSFEKMRPIPVNGTTLATVERGEGKPLVLVHGGVSDMRSWSAQFDAFSDHFRTIAYSRRYCRPNLPIAKDAADPIQTHVDDLLALIRTLNAEPAHIVGHSWGALIALLAVQQAPGICHRLVLIEPPVVSAFVNVPPKALQMLRLLVTMPRLAIAIARLGGGALAPAERAFRRGDDKEAIALFGRGVLGRRSFEALSPERYEQVWENRGPDRAQALYHGFPDLIGETFAAVENPVLLVDGADSPPVFRLLNESLARRLSNARRCAIAGASHIVHEDAPHAFNAAILDFLNGPSIPR